MEEITPTRTPNIGGKAMAEHTAGPWTEHPQQGTNTIDIRSREDVWIASVLDSHDNDKGGFPSDDECKANAKLVAAAPELLDAAHALLVGVEDAYPHTKHFTLNVKLREALAKATGH